MEVTRVKIDRLTPDRQVKATATIVLDDVLCVHQLRVVEGKNGLFVGFPNGGSYTMVDGRKRYVDIVHTFDEQLRERIQNSILEKYEQAIS